MLKCPWLESKIVFGTLSRNTVPWIALAIMAWFSSVVNEAKPIDAHWYVVGCDQTDERPPAT